MEEGEDKDEEEEELEEKELEEGENERLVAEDALCLYCALTPDHFSEYKVRVHTHTPRSLLRIQSECVHTHTLGIQS